MFARDAKRKFAIVVQLAVVLSMTASAQAPLAAQEAGGVQASGAKYRVLRAVSGSKGSQQGGRYVIEDPRTVFHVPADKQVIVYFEWEGPPGHHRFEGFWKNPEGKVSVISDFEYDSRERRFGGYWSLLLSENMPTGLWTLEARVDGELSGAHTFQVVADGKPAEIAATPARVPLTPAEIYKRALATSVFIQKLDASGIKFSTGSGFFIGENLVVTAFQVIDGAASLRVLLPGGNTVTTNQVVAFHRRQDWAILKVEAGTIPALPRAPADSWTVGDRCYSLDVPAEGNHVIVDADIIGKNTFPGAGERLNLSFASARAAVGAPLLNEYGELIGVTGGSLIPGANTLQGTRFGYPIGALELGGALRGMMAVPITLVSLNPPRMGTLAELAQAGHMTPPLLGHENVMSGTLSAEILRNEQLPRAVKEKSEFSRKEGQFFILLGVDPKEKRKTLVSLKVYDLDNRLIVQSESNSRDFRPGVLKFMDWKFPIATMTPGIYRLDVCFDQDPAWRTFFRITD
ncbi:MAG: trypsin-like peptidase domain-containing protein [Acidobacteria bacterium]|nr:trypsin-like peptidase domain-containing protein [Acidobacteriota bacterium]MBI3661545.1 trypsin-like peptidase domain-containing protein [Acidobacteriota bacterium]